MKKFAVWGNPIKQSLSPVIHQHFAAQAGIQISYDKQLSEPEHLISDLTSFFSTDNVIGCNVTAPFKEQAFAFADKAYGSAKFAQAANTLHLVNGKIEAHNTDGAGLVNDLLQHIPSLVETNVLLLGAGGAARGVMQALLDQGISRLTIANRTIEKADTLASIASNAIVSAQTLSALNESYDIVINSTSASLVGASLDLGNLSFKDTLLTYDMSYKAQQTPFLAHAAQHGSKKNVDGLGMLIGQAAVAFEIWTGFNPDVKGLIKTLRQGMLA